jgi:hypothetical protein
MEINIGFLKVFFAQIQHTFLHYSLIEMPELSLMILMLCFLADFFLLHQ